MEIKDKGIIPLWDYVEGSVDTHIDRVPEHTDHLYLLTTVLRQNALLPHLKYAAVDGNADSYEIVKDVSAQVFGAPLDDEELEMVLEYYVKVQLRLEGFNQQNIDENSTASASINQALVQAFLSSHGPSDLKRPITVDYVAAFIEAAHGDMHKWREQVGEVEQYRSEFCRGLRRLVDADMVDADMLPSMEYLARTVAITSIRPLDFMCSDLMGVNATKDVGAYYSPGTHSMSVNFVTGMHGNLTAQEARMEMRHIVYHELIHAVTLPWATSNGFGGYDREWRFPKFVTEAFAERMATIVIGKRQAKIGHDFIRRNYDVMRDEYGEYPYTFLPDGKPSDTIAYPEYTYLLDMMMSKLDWEAAGITQLEAEKLLSRALFDGPSKLHDVDKACTHWRAFHEALIKASFPGFLVHLREVFDYEGEEQMMLNYFDSPSFDPHDKDSLPRSLTSKQYDWDNYRYPNYVDEAPDTTLILGYAQQLFGYLHGYRQYEVYRDNDDSESHPGVERTYMIEQLPARFFALKAMTREIADKRAHERSAMLRQRWFAQRREEAARYQKTLD